MVKIITQIERFCPKCREYVDVASHKSEDEIKTLCKEERCLNCHTVLTYAKAMYIRKEVIKH